MIRAVHWIRTLQRRFASLSVREDHLRVHPIHASARCEPSCSHAVCRTCRPTRCTARYDAAAPAVAEQQKTAPDGCRGPGLALSAVDSKSAGLCREVPSRVAAHRVMPPSDVCCLDERQGSPKRDRRLINSCGISVPLEAASYCDVRCDGLLTVGRRGFRAVVGSWCRPSRRGGDRFAVPGLLLGPVSSYLTPAIRNARPR